MPERVAILCYHRVHADNDPATPAVEPGKYCAHVTRSVFRDQMASLAAHGFAVVNHNQILDWLEGRADLPSQRNVAIDFDDNRLNVFENAFPVMAEYGYTGTVFFLPALADGNLPDMETYPWMTWDHMADLLEAGWTVGAHTVNHAFLTDLYAEQDGAEKVEQELAQSREIIRDRLGSDVPNFAYPNGRWNEDIESIVKRYYRTARLWNMDERVRYNSIGTDPYRLECVNISMLLSNEAFEQILAGVD